ncbi:MULTISPECIES: hypothetical protein [unclassified Pseudomonas]|uniref:hypothetical protein n=1 Tax=unclassified Pseudomonas TaxID=196821 RepID=UPI000C86D1AF|nr:MULTISPECIES: hypothetical protein [unclassified Pseudomonas]PMV22647.1 hypothetical protein C1X17_13655 [Pseudomonas sp. FW305-3-2-15-C-TSA2]PMV29310.1 hypothetical protein C1X22_11225 [Pseudomonas sp. DP16D-L5]PMV39213.1 hypothetical protein C1X21_11340 [Pseudomonas sp. FW305-3-2-15-A-LB2]PMV45523.1 hypothetical protein C1X16_12870 [Pseudomonas sp. FW305-3-2-15-C-R2A1]PMV52034.1 hypothetical protein C1X18_12080 [Pseudomonas sp. FW305-3-2-15-C-LB1]
MSVTPTQIKDFIQKSEELLRLRLFADRVGFEGDFPPISLGGLVWFFDTANVEDLDEFDEFLTKQAGAMQRFIADVYEHRISRWRITSEFLCELALILKFPEIFSEELLVSSAGWDENIAQLVVAAGKRQALS